MAQYKSIERNIAELLKTSPRLKYAIKRSYQIFCYALFPPREKIQCDYQISPVYQGNEETYFGYYDKSPSRKGLLLFQVTTLDTSVSHYSFYGSELSGHNIIVYQGDREVYRDVTSTFNWQQGAKLQWVGDSEFVYNKLISEGRLGAYLVDLISGSQIELLNPVYDSFGKNYYLSVPFDALRRVNPDYGYGTTTNDDAHHRELGISLCSYSAAGQVINFMGLDKILDLYPLPFSVSQDQQCLNHISISPNGEKFVFIHRSYKLSGERFDRLFYTEVNSLEMSDPVLVSDSGMISHYCWIDSSNLICYMKHGDTKDYHRITLGETSSIINIDVPGISLFGDGHPTYIGNNRFITDTYPNRSRIKNLLLVDMNSKSISKIGSFLEPIKFYGETRCDLHPKWDAESKCIFVESTHTGSRKLYQVGPLEI